MAVLAIILSVALIELDNLITSEMLDRLGWIYSFGPEGARAILSAIASSMITVAGLTFSITMLTLQLASSQFGPRLLRNFMADRGNQIVLGTFISTFLYCLLVLRTVRGTEGSSFVPHVSVGFGVLLALASMAVLIYFIHHVATTIRIESLLESLAQETRETIERLYPQSVDDDHVQQETSVIDIDPRYAVQGSAVPATVSGYVQHIDIDALMSIATKEDLVVKIEANPGVFVTAAEPIFTLHAARKVSGETIALLQGTFVVGRERTPEQDLQFSVRRIVEIAQRALSPGTNDPTTALYCIDRLGEAFVRLARRRVPSSARFDEDRKLRIITATVSFDELVSRAFAAIARYGGTDADVMGHLLRTMKQTTDAVRTEQCLKLAALVTELTRRVGEQLPLDFDRCIALADRPRVRAVREKEGAGLA